MLRSTASWLAPVAAAACASQPDPSPSIPPSAPAHDVTFPALERTGDEAPGASTPAVDLQTRLRAAVAPRLVNGSLASDAPPQLQQFGRFVGTWTCTGQSRQPDGSWASNAAPSTWTWFFTLDGHAVQDLWEPPAESNAPVGTNLRIYDREKGQWDALWTTSNLNSFDHFVAREQDGTMVMRGERPQRAAYGPHLVRITFHTITAASFAWKYESSAMGDGKTWVEQARLSCQRQGEDSP